MCCNGQVCCCCGGDADGSVIHCRKNPPLNQNLDTNRAIVAAVRAAVDATFRKWWLGLAVEDIGVCSGEDTDDNRLV